MYSFNGVTITPHHLSRIADTKSFKEQLSSALDTWEKEGRRGIWIKIPSLQAELIPIATKVI